MPNKKYLKLLFLFLILIWGYLRCWNTYSGLNALRWYLKKRIPPENVQKLKSLLWQSIDFLHVTFTRVVLYFWIKRKLWWILLQRWLICVQSSFNHRFGRTVSLQYVSEWYFIILKNRIDSKWKMGNQNAIQKWGNNSDRFGSSWAWSYVKYKTSFWNFTNSILRKLN